MRKLITLTSILALAVAMMVTPTFTHKTVSAAGDQTGQGIMVNLRAVGALAIVNQQVYHFDQACAAGYFTNAWDGNAPTVTCSGSACNGDACGVPAAPPAPAPDPSQVTNPGGSGAADKARCTFLDGGTITETDSYSQTASVPVSCTVIVNGRSQTKSATYTFHYQYNIASGATVGAFTCWPLFSESNPDGTVHVNIIADIAGESVLKSSNPKLGTKYSFSLLDNFGANRVTNLQVSVDGGTPVATTSTVNYPVDFLYTTNAGSNGLTSLLQDGDARTILNTDSFAGNNNGGADGSALALATSAPVGADLSPGSHSVILTGTVKDNSATSLSISFSVQQIIIIVTPGCSGQ